MSANKSTKVGSRFRPKKWLGQHFLKDTEIIRAIINRANFDKFDRVLEIGAGLGALTLPLSGLVHEIFAVEKDSYLIGKLRKRLSREGIENVTIVNADILKMDFQEALGFPREKIGVIGNLPYNISSPFLEKLSNNRNLVSRAVLMFQLELARRLIASPGGKEYGAITVLLQYHAHLFSLLEVPKEAFYPRPKVNSMVLELDFQRPYPRRAKYEDRFRRVVKAAFAHRRKTLFNSFKDALSACSPEEILGALRECGIDSHKRAEMLDIDDFLCLSAAFTSLS